MSELLPKPLGHLVLLSIDKEEQVSTGGIILHTSVNELDRKRHEDARQIGTVVELGPHAYKELGDGTAWVKPGDRVYFKRYSGLEYRTKEGMLYRVVPDDDIYMLMPEVAE